MDPQRWSAVRALAEQAFERPASERDAFLHDACDGDAALRSDVERLLVADARSVDLTGLVSQEQRSALSGAALAGDLTGRTVGRYRLTGLLAVGGMGAVYIAEQSEPRRTVAFKTLAVGLHSAEALARFRYESELLARLSHPAIAQVFEAGTLEPDSPGSASLPWFAMEFVEGARDLVRFADEQQLGSAARVDLFVTLCDAVHHGHLKGVIHRDLKPGNLLVDAEGRPKVIDFGVARNSNGSGDAGGPRTQAGQVVGTLQYMSPEQLSGEPDAVDARADVYSLGLVLFELLAGAPPYELSGRSLTEAAAVVRDQPPRRLRAQAPSLPRDLEWIVGRALEKSPARRYDSAAALAADLRRWRTREPVLAGPPTALYRVSRFVSRHRVGVGAAALVLLALVAGLVATSLALGREAEQRQRAERLGGFLGSMFRSVTAEGRGPDARVVDVLDDASWRVPREFADAPLVQADVLTALGRAYDDVSLHAPAERLLRQALALRTEQLGPAHDERLLCLGLLAGVLSDTEHLAQAEQLLREGLAARAEVVAGDDPLAVWLQIHLGRVLTRREEHAAARELLGQASATLARLEAAGRAAEVLPGIAAMEQQIEETLRSIAMQRGRRDEAQGLFLPRVRRFASALDVSVPEALAAQLAAGEAPAEVLERTEAAFVMLASLDEAARREQAGDGQPLHDAWQLGFEYGRFLFDVQDDGLALALLEKVLALGPEVWGPDSVQLDQVLRYLALVRSRQGDGEGARAALLEGLRLLERHPGAYTSAKVERLIDLADPYLRSGQPELAEAQLRRALAQDGLLAEDDFLRVKMRLSLGLALTHLGRFDEAEAALLEGHALALEHLGPDHRMVGWALEFTAWHYDNAGKPEQAAEWAARHAAWVAG